MYRWPHTITYKINPDVNYSVDAIREGFDLWENVADVSFLEIDEPVALFLVADLSTVKSVFGVHPNADALNVTTLNGNVGVNSYIGLDDSELDPGTNRVLVAAHEIGHGFGLFPDRPDADPDQTIYSYQDFSRSTLQADDIETIQAALGASPGDNVIRAGNGSGTVSGGDGGDLVYGNGGADVIYGNRGADTLYGGQGADVVYGGQGDDVLAGNRGDDTMAGNLGADIFDLTGGGDDVVLDFGGGDLLRLDGFVECSVDEAGALVTHDGGTVLLVGVSDWSPDLLA